MFMVAAEEEQISKEKNTPGDESKITEAAEDLSSIGISLMIAGGLATNEQLEGQKQGQSKTSASPDHSQQGQHVHFNVQSKKGS